MVDLFWTVATSYVVLSIVGLILLAALFVGYFPLLKWFPIIGEYVPVARLVSILAMGLLCLLLGFRISSERAEAASLKLKIAAQQIDLTAANDAAQKSDQAKAELAQQAQADQERIEKYEAALKARPDCGCPLTDDDLRWLYDDGARSR